jgi:hypothetical protein
VRRRRALRHGPELTRQEVIRRPRPADRDLAILELLGGVGIAVLVFFDGFGINQVGDVDEHSVGIDPLATDFFLERTEQPVHLH